MKRQFLATFSAFALAAALSHAADKPATHVFDSVVQPLLDGHKLAGSVVAVAGKDTRSTWKWAVTPISPPNAQ